MDGNHLLPLILIAIGGGVAIGVVIGLNCRQDPVAPADFRQPKPEPPPTPPAPKGWPRLFDESTDGGAA